jgi:glycosyltransferase involved in cell wall biosynthesis
MKILFISDELPYPITSGIATRSFHLLTRLAQRHQITLACLTSSPQVSDETRAVLDQWAQDVHVFGLPEEGEPPYVRWAALIPKIGRRMRLQLRMRWSAREMARSVQELLGKHDFDLVLLYGRWTFQCVRGLRNVPIVVDCCDAEFVRLRSEFKFCSPLRRAWLALRYFEVKHVERRLAAFTPNVFFISLRDKQALMPHEHIGEVIPNGVDCRSFQRTRKADPNRVVFVGVMDYGPNEDAATFLAERIFPLVRRSVPDAQLVLVGRNPKPALLERARHWDHVEITGAVEDVQPYLDSAAVFAAPIRFASGTQNKVLEAMAMEIPVVTTSVVADGIRIDQSSEPPLRVADDPQLFADEIISLLLSPQQRVALGRRGRQFVQTHFDWDVSVGKLENLCLRAAALPSAQMAAD